MSKDFSLDLNVMLRVTLISGLFYGVLTIAGRLAAQLVAGYGSEFGRYLDIAIRLFLLWLVVTSSVRSLHALRKQVSVPILWLSGGLTGAMGVLFSALFFRLAESMGLDLALGTHVPESDVFLFYLALGLVFSLIALIHLKVRNKALGNTLEILVFLGIALAFLYLF